MIIDQEAAKEGIKFLSPEMKDYLIEFAIPGLLILTGLLLNGFFRHVTKTMEKVLRLLHNIKIDNEARDFALNDMLPQNDKSYLELKKQYRETIIEPEFESLKK